MTCGRDLVGLDGRVSEDSPLHSFRIISEGTGSVVVPVSFVAGVVVRAQCVNGDRHVLHVGLWLID